MLTASPVESIGRRASRTRSADSCSAGTFAHAWYYLTHPASSPCGDARGGRGGPWTEQHI